MRREGLLHPEYCVCQPTNYTITIPLERKTLHHMLLQYNEILQCQKPINYAANDFSMSISSVLVFTHPEHFIFISCHAH